MLDPCKCDVMKELNKELAGDVCLVAGESFNGNEDGWSSNDEGIKGVNSGCQKEIDSDGLRVGWGYVERFVRGRGQEVGHQD